MAAWTLVVLFLLAEVLVVHVVFRREGYTFSFSEVPLVAGLFLAPASVLVGAQVVGAGIALLVHRRQRPLKLCFNLAHMALEATTAALVFHVLDQGHNPLAFRAAGAVVAATAAAVIVATLSISAAISLYDGRPDPRKLATSILANFVVGVTNASLGLLTVVLLWVDRGTLWLLAAPVAILLLAYRSFTIGREKQEGLEFLYEASRVLHRAGPLEEPMVELLRLARETFHAEVAELTLVAEDGARGLRTAVAAGDETCRLEPTLVTSVAPGPTVMVSELRGERRLLGTVVVSGPSEVQGRFSRRQLHLFETFANHVAVTLENGLLEASVAQLTALREELHHQAFHDELTDLGNRLLFVSELERVVGDEARSGHAVAVLFVDLDDFKTVNDTLGHAAGDQLLTRTAERLRACLRPGDVAARLGGDEFAVLVSGLRADHDAAAVAERLLVTLREPMVVNGERVQVGASIGMATAAVGACAAGDLLRDADVAMYTAKVRGKNRWELFAPAMQRAVVVRHEAKTALRRALEGGELVLFYQPIVDLRTGRIAAAEALLRWEHPERGLLLPADFVPAAEDFGLIGAVGRFVLQAACAEAAAWQGSHPRAAPIAVSVNVSALEFEQPDFVADAVAVLRASGVPRAAVVFEITESAMVQGPEAVGARLEELRATGARLALDDFGTGYSSLSYLDSLPVDMLKIAKPFIDAPVTPRKRPPLAQAIVRLGETLGLDVVAEGVETSEQVEALAAIGCRLAQGYAFSRPVRASVMRRLAARGYLEVARQTSRMSPSCTTDTTWVPSRV